MGFDQQFLKKTMKNMIFPIFFPAASAAAAADAAAAAAFDACLGSFAGVIKPFRTHDAGVRVLSSVISVFVECFS